jgi:hypothetical protein
MNEDRINPAGVFLRTLRERPGAQSASGGELPIKQALLTLREGPLSREELVVRMSAPRGVIDETLRNLASLDLIESTGLGKQERISLSQLGERVAASE